MARIVLAILAFGAIMAIFQMVIIAIVIAGLIFRTKETLCLLLIGGFITLLGSHPVIALVLLALFVAAAIVAMKAKAKREPEDQAQLSLFPAPDEP